MKKLFGLLGLALTAGALMIGPVLAHEGREVGDYEIYFGWRNEPAFAGQLNGPEVYIGLHHGDEVSDPQAVLEALEIDLQAEITFGPENVTVALEPAFPYYADESLNLVADIIPTLPGDYVFRIFGTIGDVEVDETFDSADGEFSSVEPSSDIQFPAAGAADLDALLVRIAELEARLSALEAASGS